jgi:hypothetical protein
VARIVRDVIALRLLVDREAAATALLGPME